MVELLAKSLPSLRKELEALYTRFEVMYARAKSEKKMWKVLGDGADSDTDSKVSSSTPDVDNEDAQEAIKFTVASVLPLKKQMEEMAKALARHKRGGAPLDIAQPAKKSKAHPLMKLVRAKIAKVLPKCDDLQKQALQISKKRCLACRKDLVAGQCACNGRELHAEIVEAINKLK